jgi:midasin
VFAFVEGALVTALKEGRWILLDEINLAPAETLERLGGVLESAHGSVVLSERGDGAAVPRHPRFRLFGAMNPATDVGKRDLPAALKHRFTEIYAGECEQREDLALLVKQGLRDAAPGSAVEAIVDFYLAARKDAATTLLDSADQKPQYSLRTLSRAMEYVRAAAPVYGVQRALYDGFAMSFQTLLQAPSAAALEKLMVKHLLRGQPLKVRTGDPPFVALCLFCVFARSTAPARGAPFMGSSRS